MAILRIATHSRSNDPQSLQMKRILPEQNCQHCGKTFRPIRRWQKFCDADCRRYSFEDLSEAPSAAIRKGGEWACYYCGASANTIDHVPPQSIRPTLINLGLDRRIAFNEVRCCGECNSLLGARDIWQLSKRKQFIKKALRRRYCRLLKMPHWSESELIELNGSLHSFTIQRLALKELIEARLAW